MGRDAQTVQLFVDANLVKPGDRAGAGSEGIDAERMRIFARGVDRTAKCDRAAVGRDGQVGTQGQSAIEGQTIEAADVARVGAGGYAPSERRSRVAVTQGHVTAETHVALRSDSGTGRDCACNRRGTAALQHQCGTAGRSTQLIAGTDIAVKLLDRRARVEGEGPGAIDIALELDLGVHRGHGRIPFNADLVLESDCSCFRAGHISRQGDDARSRCVSLGAGNAQPTGRNGQTIGGHIQTGEVASHAGQAGGAQRGVLTRPGIDRQVVRSADLTAAEDQGSAVAQNRGIAGQQHAILEGEAVIAREGHTPWLGQGHPANKVRSDATVGQGDAVLERDRTTHTQAIVGGKGTFKRGATGSGRNGQGGGRCERVTQVADGRLENDRPGSSVDGQVIAGTSDITFKHDARVGRLHRQIAPQRHIAVEGDVASSRAGQVAVQRDARAARRVGLRPGNRQGGHGKRRTCPHGQRTGCRVDGVQAGEGACDRHEVHRVRTDRHRRQRHVVGVFVGQRAAAGKRHGQLVHIVGGIAQVGGSTGTPQRQGGGRHQCAGCLRDGTTGGHGQRVRHIGVLEFESIDIGNAGVASRHDGHLVEVALRIGIQRDGIGPGGERGQPRHRPLGTVGDVMVLDHRHVARRDGQVTELVARLRQRHIAVGKGHVARVDRCQGHGCRNGPIDQIPGRSLRDGVRFGQCDRRGAGGDGHITQLVGGAVQDDGVLTGVEGGDARGLPARTAVGQRPAVGHGDFGALDVEVTQGIGCVVQRDVAATERGTVLGIRMKGGGTRCPGTRTIGDRVLGGCLLGPHSYAGALPGTAQQLQVAQHVIGIVQPDTVAALGLQVGVAIGRPGLCPLRDAIAGVVLAHIDVTEHTTDAVAILRDGQVAEHVVLAAQLNGLAIGGDQRHRSCTQRPCGGLRDGVVLGDAHRRGCATDGHIRQYVVRLRQHDGIARTGVKRGHTVGGPRAGLGDTVRIGFGDQHRTLVCRTDVVLGNDQITQHVVLVQRYGLIVRGDQGHRRSAQQPGASLRDFVIFADGHQAGSPRQRDVAQHVGCVAQHNLVPLRIQVD